MKLKESDGKVLVLKALEKPEGFACKGVNGYPQPWRAINIVVSIFLLPPPSLNVNAHIST